MVGTRVFTLEKIQSLSNAFNKKMTRKPPLLGTTTKGQPEGFHLGKLRPPKIKSTSVTAPHPPRTAAKN
jgi:hypothetical protein